MAMLYPKAGLTLRYNSGDTLRATFIIQTFIEGPYLGLSLCVSDTEVSDYCPRNVHSLMKN